MKKIYVLLLIMFTFFVSMKVSSATTFEEANKGKKPFAVLVYADWADNVDDYKKVFEDMQTQFSNKYDFVMLNIASDDAKAYNDKFYIYPKLPYIVLFKENCRISRYLPNACSKDSSCFKDKLKYFVN